MAESVYEIKIRKTSDLSEPARQEVLKKLETKSESFIKNYVGYSAITYSKASPKSIAGVDPIEGTILEYSEKILSKCTSCEK